VTGLTQTLIVAAAIVDSLATPRVVLSARRRAPAELAGRWELPGGKVEAGETPVDALHRELAEELGLRVNLADQLPGPLPDDTWPLVGQLHMAVWWATPIAEGGRSKGRADGIPTAGEAHDEVRWLARGQLWEIPWLDPDIPIVHAIAERL
jgi:8-oxo-dGTP diphosphatase